MGDKKSLMPEEADSGVPVGHEEAAVKGKFHARHHPAHHASQALSHFPRHLLVLFAILGIILLLNTMQILTLSKHTSKALEKAKEDSIPAKVALTVITDKSCPQCFAITPIVEAIKKAHTNVTEEKAFDMKSDEAKALIKDFNISRIPAVIVRGELNRSNIRGLELRNDALVFTQVTAPYTDASSKKVKGLVEAIIIKDAGCKLCPALEATVTELKKTVKITKEKVAPFESQEAKGLIGKYRLERLPALLLSPELKEYPEISAEWGGLGTVEGDGWHVTRQVGPPYTNASTGKTVGLTSLIMLSDKSCSACYDVKMHKGIIARFGVAIADEKEVDLSSAEGKKLVERYNITSVPSIILSKEAASYEGFVRVWETVGTVESDGSYIFRSNNVLGQKYKNLLTNSIEGAEPQAQEEQ
ncbi:hypothetical protein HYU13_02435 [Candidatus Woesearchaeota archaeon]|nr:hypothetical protein [Candidatus Woesearchaeota archaeon]